MLASGNLKTLAILNLNNNRIGNEGTKALVVGNLSTLTSLSLNDNRIGDEGAKALANGKLVSLTSLKLDDNSIGDEGAMLLASGKLVALTSLKLDANGIGDEGVKALANGNLTALTSLKLIWNNIGAKGASSLANGNLSSLTSLKLDVNNIRAEGAQALAAGNLSSLNLLSLTENNIGDEGAKALANGNLSALKSLNLTWNNIKIKGIMALTSGNLGALTSLNLEDKNIEYNAIVFIEEMLEKNRQRLKKSSSATPLLQKNSSFSSTHENEEVYSRMRTAYESDWVYTGLSIGGEGIRGLMPALMLEHLETVSGKPLYKIFDYVGGTSVGGVLGMGIVATYDGQNPRYQVSEFVKLFSEHGQRIFSPTGVLETFKNPEGIFQSHYNPVYLEKLLKTYFQDSTLKDVLTDIMVTGVLHGTNDAFIFDSQRALLDDSQNFYLRSVGRAIFTTPTFFPSAQIWNIKRTVTYTINDGGLGLNNPTPLVCARLSQMALDRHLNANHFFTLSLGAGELMPFHTPSVNTGLEGWLAKGKTTLIETVIDSSTHYAGEYAKQQLQGKSLHLLPELFWNWEDFRQDPPDTARKVLISEVPLDKAKPKYLKLYEVAARHKALKAFGEKGAPTELVRWFQENTDRKNDQVISIGNEWKLSQQSIPVKEEFDPFQKKEPQNFFLKKKVKKQENIRGSYTLILNKEKVNIYRYKIPDNGDCGYLSLEITRKEAAKELRENSHREEVRALVAPEIYDMFAELPLEMRQVQAYQEIIREEEALDDEARLLVTAINDLLGRIEGSRWSKEELTEYLNSLPLPTQKQQNALDNLQKNTKNIRLLAEKKMQYCTQENTFKDFVNFFIKTPVLEYHNKMGISNWLNYSNVIGSDGSYRTSSADAIAFLQKKNLVIINTAGEIKHQYRFSNDPIGPNHTLFLLHIRNDHFDALKLEKNIDSSA